jgi:hypothetical protein
MEALEIESQTDQTPLKGLGLNTSQRELAQAQHLLDDAKKSLLLRRSLHLKHLSSFYY